MQISFVISSCCREKELQRCLESLRSQKKINHQIEIHIMTGNFPNRMAGYKKAHGDWVFFLDEDIVLPDSDWLENIASVIKQNADAAVIGGSYKKNSGSYLENAYNFICDQWVKAALGPESSSGLAEAQNLLGGIFALNKKLLGETVTELSASFWGGEDTFLIRQLQAKGIKSFYSAHWDVFHLNSLSVRHLMRRALLQGKHRNRYHLKTPRLRWRYYLSLQTSVYIPVLLLHQICVETGSFLEARRKLARKEQPQVS